MQACRATIPTMTTESTLISVREAARRLGVHDNTIRRYADRGLIRAVRLPSGVRRLRREDVEALSAPVASSADPAGARRPERSLAELTADQGVEPPGSLDELARPEIWQSDDEAVAFLRLTYAERDRDR